MIIIGMVHYLYYRIAWWHTHVIKDSGNIVFSSSIGVSAFEILNITSLLSIFLISMGNGFMERYDKTIQSAMIISVAVFNYFYFRKNHVKVISLYDSYDMDRKRPMDRIVIAYIVGTILLLIGAIIYGRARYAS